MHQNGNCVSTTELCASVGMHWVICHTMLLMQEQYGKETLRNSHLYQIRTYVDEYDGEHTHKVDGMLLYAKTKEDVFEDAQITHRDGYTLYIRTLDYRIRYGCSIIYGFWFRKK